MSRISDLRLSHYRSLQDHCRITGVTAESVQKLLEAEKTKKLLKRNALIQQTIDREIDKAIENED